MHSKLPESLRSLDELLAGKTWIRFDLSCGIVFSKPLPTEFSPP
jgi:hypothetical protein